MLLSYEVRYMNVITIFLYNFLAEEIYMELFYNYKKESYVCCLNKTLYNFKQASYV